MQQLLFRCSHLPLRPRPRPPPAPRLDPTSRVGRRRRAAGVAHRSPESGIRSPKRRALPDKKNSGITGVVQGRKTFARKRDGSEVPTKRSQKFPVQKLQTAPPTERSRKSGSGWKKKKKKIGLSHSRAKQGKANQSKARRKGKETVRCG